MGSEDYTMKCVCVCVCVCVCPRSRPPQPNPPINELSHWKKRGLIVNKSMCMYSKNHIIRKYFEVMDALCCVCWGGLTKWEDVLKMARLLVPTTVSVGRTIKPFSARSLTKHLTVMWGRLRDDAVTPCSVAVGGLSLESFWSVCVFTIRVWNMSWPSGGGEKVWFRISRITHYVRCSCKYIFVFFSWAKAHIMYKWIVTKKDLVHLLNRYKFKSRQHVHIHNGLGLAFWGWGTYVYYNQLKGPILREDQVLCRGRPLRLPSDVLFKVEVWDLQSTTAGGVN